MALETGIIAVVVSVVTSVTVTVVAQGMVKFWLEPLHELRQQLRLLRRDLLVYEGIFLHPKPAGGPGHWKAKGVLLQHAADLTVNTASVPLVTLLQRLSIVHSRKRLDAIDGILRRLAQGVFTGKPDENLAFRDELLRLL